MTVKERKRQREVIAYWRESAARDWVTARDMFEIAHYDWSLFVAHLAIEKLLKALVVQKTEETPPKIHDLIRLAFLAHIKLSSEHQAWLEEITRFNLETRYPEQKTAFYKTATKNYTIIWLNRCQEVFLWLDKQFD